VAFNDVDFCLLVRAQGYRIVWTPHAELYHLESASRGSDIAPEKMERRQREIDYRAGGGVCCRQTLSTIPTCGWMIPCGLAFPPLVEKQRQAE
jgi:O-antigen biosynthesis protein